MSIFNKILRVDMKIVLFILFFIPLALFGQPQQKNQIIQNIISESVANYPGACPCPYNRASNGSSCGRRNAYSKPGGYSPICYTSDVTPAMISSYKHKHGIRQ